MCSHREVEAWMRLMRIDLEPYEVEGVLALADAMLPEVEDEAEVKKEERKRTKAKKEELTARYWGPKNA